MTVDQLNSRYGAPGRIVFHPGFAGYPEVVLANKYGTAEIALLGANVLSYRPTGHSPVLFLSFADGYQGSGEAVEPTFEFIILALQLIHKGLHFCHLLLCLLKEHLSILGHEQADERVCRGTGGLLLRQPGEH